MADDLAPTPPARCRHGLRVERCRVCRPCPFCGCLLNRHFIEYRRQLSGEVLALDGCRVHSSCPGFYADIFGTDASMGKQLIP